jgi:DNA-binding transcriptional regulator YiaG
VRPIHGDDPLGIGFYNNTTPIMPNIASVLKGEILRLSRGEVRRQLKATLQLTRQQRTHVAALRREVTRLERELRALRKQLPRAAREAAPVAGAAQRFVRKGFRSHRDRLGLSAADCGKLLGVSAQTIYNWERGASNPPRSQMGRIAFLRTIGKRQVQARLAEMTG